MEDLPERDRLRFRIERPRKTPGCATSATTRSSGSASSTSASRRVVALVPTFLAQAPGEIASRERALQSTELTGKAREKVQRELETLRRGLVAAQDERVRYTDAAWNALAPRARSAAREGVHTNAAHGPYRALTRLSYDDKGTERDVAVPAGDVLHQFRRMR